MFCTGSSGPEPITSPPPSTLAGAPRLPSNWEAETREIYKTSIETPTVAGRHNVPRLAELPRRQVQGGGWAASDVRVSPMLRSTIRKTAALIARWPSAKPTKKPILIMAHMDVVEAIPGDWTTDPFKLVEKDGYFYGRGSGDDKERQSFP